MPKPTLALCLEYPLALRGGVSVLVEELARGLADEYRLVLVSLDEAPPVALAPLIAGHVQWDPASASRATASALAAKLRELRCDIAHFHIGGVFGWGMRFPGSSPFGFVARAGIAVCSTVHLTVSILDGYCGLVKPLWFKLALLPLAWCGKLSALRDTRVEIAVSRHDESKLRRWYAPLAGRFRQIYHSRLRLTEARADAPRRNTILNVGHIAHRKGQHHLVGAFGRIAARHPAWTLQLAGPEGEPSDMSRLWEAAERGGVKDRVQWLGSRDDAQELMRTAGVYVQPSLEEALGLALQEALFAGSPSIGTTAGGIPELIADGDNGLLVPKGDEAALAAALDRLLSDAELRAKLSKRARASIVERGMTFDHMIQQHRDLYRSLLADR